MTDRLERAPRKGEDGALGGVGLRAAAVRRRAAEAVGRIGSRPAVVWLIKHVVSPLDRLVIEVGKGRVRPPSSLAVPTLLLTTEGRRSGRDRTVPLVYVRSEGGGFVVANARPAGERRNPWVLNLEASRSGRVTVGTTTIDVVARALDGVQADRWWPRLVSVWPAFGEHYAATGERTVFVLEPTTGP